MERAQEERARLLEGALGKVREDLAEVERKRDMEKAREAQRHAHQVAALRTEVDALNRWRREHEEQAVRRLARSRGDSGGDQSSLLSSAQSAGGAGGASTATGVTTATTASGPSGGGSDQGGAGAASLNNRSSSESTSSTDPDAKIQGMKLRELEKRYDLLSKKYTDLLQRRGGGASGGPSIVLGGDHLHLNTSTSSTPKNALSKISSSVATSSATFAPQHRPPLHNSGTGGRSTSTAQKRATSLTRSLAGTSGNNNMTSPALDFSKRASPMLSRGGSFSAVSSTNDSNHLPPRGGCSTSSNQRRSSVPRRKTDAPASSTSSTSSSTSMVELEQSRRKIDVLVAEGMKGLKSRDHEDDTSADTATSSSLKEIDNNIYCTSQNSSQEIIQERAFYNSTKSKSKASASPEDHATTTAADTDAWSSSSDADVGAEEVRVLPDPEAMAGVPSPSKMAVADIENMFIAKGGASSSSARTSPGGAKHLQDHPAINAHGAKTKPSLLDAVRRRIDKNKSRETSEERVSVMLPSSIGQDGLHGSPPNVPKQKASSSPQQNKGSSPKQKKASASRSRSRSESPKTKSTRPDNIGKKSPSRDKRSSMKSPASRGKNINKAPRPIASLPMTTQHSGSGATSSSSNYTRGGAGTTSLRSSPSSSGAGFTTSTLTSHYQNKPPPPTSSTTSVTGVSSSSVHLSTSSNNSTTSTTFACSSRNRSPPLRRLSSAMSSEEIARLAKAAAADPKAFASAFAARPIPRGRLSGPPGSRRRNASPQ
ncbi:unnamed protein product [Amoebophrya sp. A25]|nr:unnamed protein product [Amoebophrya sp. A25]|eukprot:GSA25T00026122001.1